MGLISEWLTLHSAERYTWRRRRQQSNDQIQEQQTATHSGRTQHHHILGSPNCVNHSPEFHRPHDHTISRNRSVHDDVFFDPHHRNECSTGRDLCCNGCVNNPITTSIQKCFADNGVAQVCFSAGRFCWYYNSQSLTLNVSLRLERDPLSGTFSAHRL